MPKHNSRILAIDPGTRNMGIAFLDNSKLIYHGVKCIGSEESPHDRLNEGRKTVLRLIRDFRPQVLAVEESFFGSSCKSSLLNVFVDEIKAIGKRKGLRVVSYAPTTVRKFICGNGRASKKELSKVVVSKYLELKGLPDPGQSLEGAIPPEYVRCVVSGSDGFLPGNHRVAEKGLAVVLPLHMFSGQLILPPDRQFSGNADGCSLKA